VYSLATHQRLASAAVFHGPHGADALIDRMEAVELPWVFDENNRPSLLEEKVDGLR
jgi:hypothetical protein